jgi:predicted Zn-dependent peptidase
LLDDALVPLDLPSLESNALVYPLPDLKVTVGGGKFSGCLFQECRVLRELAFGFFELRASVGESGCQNRNAIGH